MRKRVTRAIIFLAIAVAAGVGAATAAGAITAPHGQNVVTTDDGSTWQ